MLTLPKKLRRTLPLVLWLWPVLGCREDLATTLETDLIPVSAVTVEARLPFDEFAKNLKVWGGYGRPYELPTGIVAHAFGGLLEARTLVSWGTYPTVASVRDSTGSIRPDTVLTFVGGRVVARFDTLSSVREGPVTLALGALQDDWDYRSVTWTLAVDSVGEQRPWPEGGAGPVTPLATAEWGMEAGDSVVFELDSAAVALWGDTATSRRGARLDAVTEGVRLNVTSLGLVLLTRASINPDTLVELSVGSLRRTFVYDPLLDPPERGIRVGGVPAWRTVFEMDVPASLDGPPELCAKVGCPLQLTPESLISASLVLRTQAPPPAFQPTDSLWLDVRPVLEPARLPKSPLGSSLAGLFGVRLYPEDFGVNDGVEVSIPLGSYVESLLEAARDPEVEVAHTVALLSAFEPLSLFFVSFEGPDSPSGGPELRLILTYGEEVGIR